MVILPAAPNLSAKSYMSLKFSALFKPLPPETMTFAAPNSGRSLLTTCSDTHLERDFPITELCSTFADPPVAADGGKAVGRIVNNFRESIDLTVAIAFPRYLIKNLILSYPHILAF
jgi:hypothetical protein